MRIHRVGIALTLALSIVPGCRSASMAHRASKPAMRNSATAVVEKNGQRQTEVPSEPAESADQTTSPIRLVSEEVPELPTAEYDTGVMRLTIHAAIEMGLAQNPDLIALRLNEGVGTAALSVAQTYPFNPFIQAQATPYQVAQNGGPGTTYHYVLMMQQIQLAHQQTFREQAACASLNSIRWNVVQSELQNVAQTERLYFTAVYQRGLRNLANIYAENNQQLLTILKSQFNAGQATAADLAIVKLDARSTLQQQRIAEANFQTALLDLKRQLGLEPDAKIELEEDIANWTWQPAQSGELAILSSNRPDVMASRSDTETARANTSFANAARVPDLQIGPYYQRTDTGITYVGLRAQMDVPILNDGVPLLRQRQAELTQRAVTAQQLATRARLEAEAATDRYERARQLVVQSSDLPRAELPIELQQLEKQFSENEVDILRVLQARTSLLQNQRADLDALNELLQSAVAVTLTSGCPLESLVSGGTMQADSLKID